MRFKCHFTESGEVFCLSQAQEVPYLRQRLKLQRTPSTSKSSELSITLKVTTMLRPPGDVVELVEWLACVLSTHRELGFILSAA